ncbi:uncharacterized protein EV154DRAFT_421730, partial [Mucor mucedo]|uniref:uncharacterized protein n=1 Tax=Mucor mucedo TaxID=29922 RepID=UPI00221ECDA8
TSQTCNFCFQKLRHPYERIKNKQNKTVSGPFICHNLHCLSVALNQATHGRDTLFAAAIAFPGASFDPKISQKKKYL